MVWVPNRVGAKDCARFPGWLLGESVKLIRVCVLCGLQWFFWSHLTLPCLRAQLNRQSSLHGTFRLEIENPSSLACCPVLSEVPRGSCDGSRAILWVFTVFVACWWFHK